MHHRPNDCYCGGDTMFFCRSPKCRKYPDIEDHIGNHVHSDGRLCAFGQRKLRRPNSSIRNECIESWKRCSDTFAKRKYRLIAGKIKLPNFNRRFLAVDVANDGVLGRIASLKAATSENECRDVEPSPVMFESRWSAFWWSSRTMSIQMFRTF
jgi:hypothetical protein